MKISKSPTKRKPTKRVVKGWAVIDKQAGHIKSHNGIYWSKEDALKAIEDTWPYAVVAISITYHLPPKTT